MPIHPNESWLEGLTGEALYALAQEADALGPAYARAYREQLTRLVLIRRLPPTL